MWFWFPLILLVAFARGESITKQEETHLVDPAVVQLNLKNFQNTTGFKSPFKDNKLNTNATHDWFIIFYSPTCPHCQRTLPSWNEFAKQVNAQGSGKPYQVAAVNCPQNWDICDGFDIDGYPTLLYVTKDHEVYTFQSQRNKQGYSKFADSNSEAKKLFKYRSSKDMDWPERIVHIWKNLSTTGVVLLASILFLVALLIYVILDKQSDESGKQQNQKFSEESGIGLPDDEL